MPLCIFYMTLFFLTCRALVVVWQADYLQPKLLGILAFFNMQLLSSSAGEKDRKKLVCEPLLTTNLIFMKVLFSSQQYCNWFVLRFLLRKKVSVCFFCAGVDKCDGFNATDGLQTHQLCQSKDDDDAPHGPPIQRGLPSALLPVSTHTHTLRSQRNCSLLHLLFSRHLTSNHWMTAKTDKKDTL